MKKDNKFQFEALTYDDVLLVPAYSEVVPNEVDIKASLTRNISLNIPLISASMDTITESKLAIAIALKGGIGIVHKNMSITKQAEEIRKVKRSQSGMIKDPITLGIESKVKDAVLIMKKNHIGGIPIINDATDLVGASGDQTNGPNEAAGAAVTFTDDSTADCSADKVWFLFIKNTGTSDTSNTSTTNSVYVSLDTTAAAHDSGAKVFGSYLITKQTTTETIASPPGSVTVSNSFTFSLKNNASSAETGGGFFCFGGPVNERP